jgi:hypothetical protein
VIRRRRTATARLIALIAVLLLCMWLLYRLFIAVPPAPPPTIKIAAAVSCLPGPG